MIWFAGVVVIGLIALYGLVQSLRARLALRWPHVDGTVDRCEVRELGEDTERYERDFAYSYTVGGRRYTGTRVDAADDLVRSHHQRWLLTSIERFAPGQTVRVFYAPNDPADAIVSKVRLVGLRYPATWFWALLLAIVWGLLAAVPHRWSAQLQAPDLSGWLPAQPLTAAATGLLGLSLALLAWRLALPLRMALLFRKVTATVLLARVATTRKGGSGDGPDVASYAADVEYEYEVGGVVYQGDRLAWDSTTVATSQEKSARRRVQAFRVGEPIEVSVHRLDPALSVVDGGLHIEYLMTPLLLAALASALLWFAPPRVPQAAPAATAGVPRTTGAAPPAPAAAPPPAPAGEAAPAAPPRHKAHHRARAPKHQPAKEPADRAADE